MTEPISIEPIAARFACAVAERDHTETHAILNALDRDGLMALAVVLGASVDLDAPLAATKSSRTDAIVRRIALEVGDHLGINDTDITGPGRRQDVAEARMILCWIAAAQGLRPTYVGEALGRDHSTVIRAVDKVTSTPKLLAEATKIREHIEHQKGAA